MDDPNNSGKKGIVMGKGILLTMATASLLVIALGAAAGVSGPAFYVDGEQYRTVGTPTDFSTTGAPDHTFDTIYEFSGAQALNVATAAPGDAGYNGGRWRVQVVGYASGHSYDSALAAFDANDSGDFDFAAEVESAIAAGVITTSDGPSFACPVIPLPNKGG
ncbi:MAG TPA: hypothetical protein VJ815_10970 [Acidimicrobiia bacterium]|nr:hypothetical protein [Acidimicrobiia bacterium]